MPATALPVENITFWSFFFAAFLSTFWGPGPPPKSDLCCFSVLSVSGVLAHQGKKKTFWIFLGDGVLTPKPCEETRGQDFFLLLLLLS